MTNPVTASPSLRDTILVFAKIGVLSFGGPAAQIALMHRMLVEERRWLSEHKYLNALSFCMLLPGPEAMQLATYAGWRFHGVLGGLIAGLLFVIPGAIVVLALALVYAQFGDVPLVTALFLGIKATVLVIVMEALLRVAKRALNGRLYWIIAATSFILIFFFSFPYPLLIFAAAVIGFFLGSETNAINDSENTDSALPNERSWSKLISTVLIWLTLWVVPLLIIDNFTDQNILTEIGTYFSRLAVVTFGGAYAVLAYMGQTVVGEFGWLTAGEMMDGLGLAETTPGPLILVTEFVGFIAAYRQGGIGLGLAGALITLWTTFVPCFLWIFAGAPHIDWICNQPRFRGALTAISAAVVGVILNLSLWFGLHVVFKTVTFTEKGLLTLWIPRIQSLDIRVLVLTILCSMLIFKWHWSIVKVLLLSALLGMSMGVFPR
jgi:chromate transporter